MRIEWNGKKLTKKRALFLCWKLWEWLGKNPDKDKSNWPHWESNGGLVANMLNSCPVCHECGGTAFCQKCLLIDYWPKGCTHDDSTFMKWVDIGFCDGAAKYAKRIAAAAKRRYEKL